MSFNRFATAIADAVGRAGVFIAALLFVVVWAATGPFFGFSDTWQLIINTSTTVITFLMIFLVQHTQNQDTKEIKAMLQAEIEAEGLEDEKEAKLEGK